MSALSCNTGWRRTYLFEEGFKGDRPFCSNNCRVWLCRVLLYVARDSDSTGGERRSKLVISGLILVVGIIVHVVGIVEAYNDAIDINEEKYYFGKEKSESPFVASVVYE